MAGTFTQNIKNKFVEAFKESVGNTASNFYIAFGKYFEWDDDSIPPLPNTSVQTSFIDVNKEMIFGKKVTPDDIVCVGKKINWTSGTVYDYYTHNDPNLYSKNFYVINSLNRVYKCLFNNYGAPSTVEPNLTVSKGDFNTSDGYKWKFMFAINNKNVKKFSTDVYFPIIPNPTVVATAEPGALHVILPSNSGNNYISGNGTFDSIISDKKFKVSNSGVISISGAYTNSYFYISAGSGSGALTLIKDYIVNSSGKYVFTDKSITGLSSTSKFKIGPQVYITGDGSGAKAISEVNANGNISSIRVIARGRNYTYANISIECNTYFGSNATAYAIISPEEGHGSNPTSELGGDTVGLSVSTSSFDNLPPWGKYRQVSLIQNPTAAANLANFQGRTFNQMLNFGVLTAPSLLSVGEEIQGFNSKAKATVAFMNTSSIYVLNEVGTFNPYETITSLSSGKTVVISTINNKDLVPYSSEVLYYKNIEPISRTGIKSEDVKIYFKF
jgi:hypothetical protein